MSRKPRLGSLVKSVTDLVVFWLFEKGHFPPSKPRRWTFDCKVNTFFRTDQRNAKKNYFLQDKGAFFR